MIEILKFIGMALLILVPIMCLVVSVLVVPDIIIEKNDNKKRQKQEEEYKKQGIEKRWAEMGCGFYICKTNNDGTFYLNKNGCFYNTTTNVREHNFDTEDELNKYLEDNADDIKAKYGEVEFKKYRKRIYLGYCKQI